MAAILMIWIAIFVTYTDSQDLSSPAQGFDSLVQYRPGDILIAGLMPVHARGNETCSVIQEIGVEAVETMNMIIDQVNANSSILPQIKLGSIMIDTCHSDTETVRRLILDILPLLLNESREASNQQRPKIPPSLVAGVVGGASSAVSIQVANVLQALKIPQVSYWSTSPDLSDKKRFKYFFRVVASDSNQANAIVNFVKGQGWTYISIVYEDDSYGYHGFQEIRDRIQHHGICLNSVQQVPRSPTDQDFKDIVTNLLDKDAKAVVVFTKYMDASRLMIAAQEIGDKSKDLVWIGTDGWTNLIPDPAEHEFDDSILHGAVGFRLAATPLADFKEYFLNLTLEKNMNNFRNPWFAEYFVKNKQCHLGDANVTTKRQCVLNETISPESFRNDALMEHVADSVLALIHALDQYHKTVCNGAPGVCPEMRHYDGKSSLASELFPILRNLNFTNPNGKIVRFDANHDGRAVYDIMNFRSNKQVRSGPPSEKWEKVGTYKDNAIHWEKTLVDKVNKVDSVCSKPCDPGMAKIMETEICCWHCVLCANYEFVSNNGTDCSRCPEGQTPNQEMTGCILLPITETSYGSLYGIICTCVGSVGLFLTLIVTVIYIAHKDTAIVKASGNELCFIILFGAAITFFNFIAMAASPTFASCIFSRLILGLGPTLMYAGLLTKTMRVVIIFKCKSTLSPKMRKYLRPCYQILTILVMVFVQVLLLLAWFVQSPPVVGSHYPTNEIAFRACNDLVGLEVLIGLLYPFLLIILCTVLATFNRHIPTGFNETKYIGFSMYTTCVIWLAFLPIFITNNTDLGLRIMTTSICLSLSATTVLTCLFGPKCFKILFRPAANNRRAMMSPSYKNTQTAIPSRSTADTD